MIYVHFLHIGFLSLLSGVYILFAWLLHGGGLIAGSLVSVNDE